MESLRDELYIGYDPAVGMWFVQLADYNFGYYADKEQAEFKGEVIADWAAAYAYQRRLQDMPLPAAVERYEMDRITLAMRRGLNQTEAAKDLGMPRQTINDKLQEVKRVQEAR